MAGCVQPEEADTARLHWSVRGPELATYAELFAAAGVYTGQVCADITIEVEAKTALTFWLYKLG